MTIRPQRNFFVKNLGLHRVGFEPTRPKPAELKSAPLDHSGICAFFVKKKISKSKFRSWDLRVMSPTRFHCANLLSSSHSDSNRGLLIQSQLSLTARLWELKFKTIKMHGTRFELARPKPSELESDPLDHSGTHAHNS